MRPLWLPLAGLLCASCAAEPRDGTLRVQLTSWDAANEVGFVPSTITALAGDVGGLLTWHGGGDTYSVTPSTGATQVTAHVEPLGLPVAVDPCPQGEPDGYSGNVDVCARSIEGEVRVTLVTADGALSEEVTCPLKAFAATDWLIICPAFDTLQGSLSIAEAGDAKVSVSLAANGAGVDGFVYVGEAWAEEGRGTGATGMASATVGTWSTN